MRQSWCRDFNETSIHLTAHPFISPFQLLSCPPFPMSPHCSAFQLNLCRFISSLSLRSIRHPTVSSSVVPLYSFPSLTLVWLLESRKALPLHDNINSTESHSFSDLKKGDVDTRPYDDRGKQKMHETWKKNDCIKDEGH